MARLTGHLLHVPFGIRQPILVRCDGVVARLAAAHGGLAFRRHLELRALAARQGVVGPLDVLADLQASRVIKQMGKLVVLRLLVVHRVVERVMAVGAFQAALGVDVPGVGSDRSCPPG